MLFVTRHRVPVSEAAAFADAAQVAVDALAARPGFVSAQVGRCLDDAELWVLTSTWATIGAGRRAMSSGETRVALMPVMVSALDEPSAFDIAVPR
ncbi:antibiotic biosynthesis monooxygenase [Motilibacter peucedani]|uniref:Antibiotic biosynthesis monooxygenase n=1 Tax=Motilibacter peucedani TaxID=598650 RepID=A0A420XP12_9ACTN|nr:antibiotic biosynthesis monooxygenase [Motilibacter peucedani]